MEELKECDSKFIYLDGYKFTRDERTGYYRCDALRKRLHQYVWERNNGKIKENQHIHHIDGNKKNNHISNLQKLSASEHMILHGEELTEEERSSRRDNLNVNARPMANEWHSSVEGRKWHKHQYELTKDKLHEKHVKECEQCGETFENIKRSKFCSNKCKSEWRRKQGLDNIEKECEFCGNKYITNKYYKSKTCSRSCSNRNRKRLKEASS